MGSHVCLGEVPVGVRETGYQSGSTVLPTGNSPEDREAGGTENLQKPAVDFPEGFHTIPQGENQSDLVRGQLAWFYQDVRLATGLSGLEPSGLFYMGCLGGKGQLYRTQKFGLSQASR